jgi:hypothetical protein
VVTTKDDEKRIGADLWGLAAARLMANRDHPLAPFFLAPWHDPVASGVVGSALACEQRIPGLGKRFIAELCEAGRGAGASEQFDMLLQKLAELYILGWLCMVKWPDGAVFDHEPKSPVSGKRPELVVDTASGRFVFEVKTPKLAQFRRERSDKPVQLLGRIVPKDQLGELFSGAEHTSPRDNPMKDFLVDANEKFQGFKAAPEDRAYLVVVWDGQFPEPISALLNPLSGLFTPQSFAKDEQGGPLAFPEVDGVLLVSRLGVFINVLEGKPRPDGPNMMRPLLSDSLPTASALAPSGNPLPDWLAEALRIVPAGDPNVPAADLQPLDFVFWLPKRPKGG